jgi:hypothetical protein
MRFCNGVLMKRTIRADMGSLHSITAIVVVNLRSYCSQCVYYQMKVR